MEAEVLSEAKSISTKTAKVVAKDLKQKIFFRINK